MYLYCTSLVFHIWVNGPLLLNFKALIRFLLLQTTDWEKDETYEQYLLERNVSIDEAEVNCLTNTKIVSVRAKRASTKCNLL